MCHWRSKMQDILRILTSLIGTSSTHLVLREWRVAINVSYTSQQVSQLFLLPCIVLMCPQTGAADPHSHFLYLRSKGLTELGLAKLGFDETIVFQPGLLTDLHRSSPRFVESLLE